MAYSNKKVFKPFRIQSNKDSIKIENFSIAGQPLIEIVIPKKEFEKYMIKEKEDATAARNVIQQKESNIKKYQTNISDEAIDADLSAIDFNSQFKKKKKLFNKG